MSSDGPGVQLVETVSRPMEPQRRHTGRLIVLSGPSGSGKSTIVRRTLATGDVAVRKAVSATTRPPRPGEVDGVNYHFWTSEQFDQAVRADAFLEWAQVYGQRYGTLHSEVDRYLEQGECVLLEIDVQGAMQIRRLYPDCVLVFLRASSLAEYERRLRGRRTESDAEVERRVLAVQQELAQAPAYDYEVINDDLEEAVRMFRQLLQRCGGDRRVG